MKGKEVEMATDCEKLSANAQKIFEEITVYFPLGPFKEPQWTEEGKVFDNEWYDLRKSEDRDRLINFKISLLGDFVRMKAGVYRGKNSSLEGFELEHFSMSLRKKAELALLLGDLDFQIETMDIVEGQPK